MNDTPWSWRNQAACKGQDTSLFFPIRGEDFRPAVAICNTCSVSNECLEEALSIDRHFDHGIYGGMSGRQRQRIRTQRAGRIEHGPRGNRQGCSCSICRAAGAAKNRARRARSDPQAGSYIVSNQTSDHQEGVA